MWWPDLAIWGCLFRTQQPWYADMCIGRRVKDGRCCISPEFWLTLKQFEVLYTFEILLFDKKEYKTTFDTQFFEGLISTFTKDLTGISGCVFFVSAMYWRKCQQLHRGCGWRREKHEKIKAFRPCNFSVCVYVRHQKKTAAVLAQHKKGTSS